MKIWSTATGCAKPTVIVPAHSTCQIMHRLSFEPRAAIVRCFAEAKSHQRSVAHRSDR